MVILGDFVRPQKWKCTTTAHTKLIKSVDDFDRRKCPLNHRETFGEDQQLLRHLCHRLHIADERKVTFAFREYRDTSTTTSVDAIPHDLQPLKQAINTLAFRWPNVNEVLTWWTTRLHRLEIHFLCLACIHLSWLTALVLLCHCSNLLRTCHPGWRKDGEAQWKRNESSAMKDRLCVPMKNSWIYFKCN